MANYNLPKALMSREIVHTLQNIGQEQKHYSENLESQEPEIINH